MSTDIISRLLDRVRELNVERSTLVRRRRELDVSRIAAQDALRADPSRSEQALDVIEAELRRVDAMLESVDRELESTRANANAESIAAKVAEADEIWSRCGAAEFRSTLASIYAAVEEAGIAIARAHVQIMTRMRQAQHEAMRAAQLDAELGRAKQRPIDDVRIIGDFNRALARGIHRAGVNSLDLRCRNWLSIWDYRADPEVVSAPVDRAD